MSGWGETLGATPTPARLLRSRRLRRRRPHRRLQGVSGDSHWVPIATGAGTGADAARSGVEVLQGLLGLVFGALHLRGRLGWPESVTRLSQWQPLHESAGAGAGAGVGVAMGCTGEHRR